MSQKNNTDVAHYNCNADRPILIFFWQVIDTEFELSITSLFNFSCLFAITSLIRCKITILYTPMAKSKKNVKCQPPQIQNTWIDFDEIQTLELPPEDHPQRKTSFWSDDDSGLSKYPVCHCHREDNLKGSCFPSSAEILVRRGGITNHHSISYSLKKISAKN